MYRNFSYAYSVVLLPIAINCKVGDSRALDNPGFSHANFCLELALLFLFFKIE